VLTLWQLRMRFEANEHPQPRLPKYFWTISDDKIADPIAFTSIAEGRPLAEAKAVDAAVAARGKLGPLCGVPYAVKNSFDVEGMSTLAGSRINLEPPPSERDAVAVQRMRQAGAILVGTLNMEEYAYGFTTENIERKANASWSPDCRGTLA
jgi:Asp-tRNA(Asn)/Glu-tRNA(Gln) amidotransferase A subunit family amidase